MDGQTIALVSLGITSIGLIITSFARGWIVSKLTVETLLTIQNLRIAEAIKRGDDYKTAWELEVARGETQQTMIDQLAIVAENQVKLLDSLPSPHSGGNGEKMAQ